MILLATSHQADYPELANSVSGVLLLGTPHRGTTDNVDRSLLLYFVLCMQTQKQHVEPNILESMRRGSDILEEIVEDFQKLLSRRRDDGQEIYGRCFFEQKSSQMTYFVPGSDRRVTNTPS